MVYGAGGSFGQHAGVRVPRDPPDQSGPHPSRHHTKNWWNLTLLSDQRQQEIINHIHKNTLW